MHGVDHCTRPGALVLVLASLVVPAMAGCGTILAGEWVFIGEEGLDIARTGAAAGSQLAYYGPGGSVSSAPAAKVTVADPASFYVAPSVFSGKTGPWFLLPGNSLAFYVGDPTLQLRIVDYTSGFVVGRDASWVPKGDAVGFRIDTNLWVFSRRPGCAGAPLTIEVSGPGGTTFSSLGGYSLAGVVVSTPTFETGPVWPTGSSEFSIGDYEVCVRCEENKMHDNYPVAGKSESEKVHLLLQKANPLIVTVTTTAVPERTTPEITTVQPDTPTLAETATLSTVPTTIETEAPQESPTPTQSPGIVPATLLLAFFAVVALRGRK